MPDELELSDSGVALLNALVDAKVMETTKEAIRLGKLIDSLRAVRDQQKSLSFDFGGFVPHSINSYRGYYNHLAISYVGPEKECTVAMLLKVTEDALGRVYSGYKGGDFRMHMETPVWASNRGECHSTAIVSVTEHPWCVILDTKFID